MVRIGFLGAILIFFSPGLLFAQQVCPPVKVPAPDPSRLLFTPQQEMDLGDAVAEEFQRELRVIDDEDLTGYLRRVGERVVRHLPDSKLQFTFYLYDRPEVQAFGTPGGRIYVSRKMAAFVRSEDELAGLLGHELGHLVARQQALDLTAVFRELLGVEPVRTDEREHEYGTNTLLPHVASIQVTQPTDGVLRAQGLGRAVLAR
ncbi:MAG TPA: M48 family metalloprotease [Candidatus Acidoferrales bacterium]|nr:M48 family metalloprotease [Candidatus Acidoferrales bacterium]